MLKGFRAIDQRGFGDRPPERNADNFATSFKFIQSFSI